MLSDNERNTKIIAGVVATFVFLLVLSALVCYFRWKSIQENKIHMSELKLIPLETNYEPEPQDGINHSPRHVNDLKLRHLNRPSGLGMSLESFEFWRHTDRETVETPMTKKTQAKQQSSGTIDHYLE